MSATDLFAHPDAVEAIERATLQAVRPDVVETLPGWLLPMDAGTVGRAHSAVPLAHPADATHQAQQAAQVPHIAARYRAHGLVPVFRLPDVVDAVDGADGTAGADRLHTAVRQQGATRTEPTWVMTAPVSALAAMRVPDHRCPVHVSADTQPSPAWQALFVGEGLDPVDGAHRVRLLSRAPQTLFVSARVDGETVACGAATFGQGWMGVHGMRTAAPHRGQGHAGRVLQAMARLAAGQAWAHDPDGGTGQAAAVQHAFLQVGAGNGSALALYQRAGFTPAWRYAYWRCPG